MLLNYALREEESGDGERAHKGNIVLGGNILLLDIWMVDIKPYTHFMHFLYLCFI